MLIAGVVLALLVSACAGILPTDLPAQATATSSPQAGKTETEEPTEEQAESTDLVIWLPPQFDTNSSGLAASMLQARLGEFADQHPQVRIQVRVKAEEGTGGMLDSLQQAQAAAPLALPDLVLLPHTQLAAAAQSGLAKPVGLGGGDLYGFAEEMARVDGQSFGIPFAADALIAAFRPSAVEAYPANWSALLESRLTLGFAAADPDALFTIAQLIAAEETEAPIDGGFAPSQEALSSVFSFFESGTERGNFPFWLTQYETQDQSWQAFAEGRVPMVVTRISRVLDVRNVDVIGATLPTDDGEAFTLVEGWVWAVTSAQSESAALASELAEFLTTPEFLAQWTAAAGLLPTQPASLAAWAPDARQALASQLVEEARALPDDDMLDLWGAPLSEAVIALLKQEINAEEAVQAVLAAVAEAN
jgi:ABC-type glycerol-3-phosphate transport system substrate-binding protein